MRLMRPAQLMRMSTLPNAVECGGEQRFERGAVADVGRPGAGSCGRAPRSQRQFRPPAAGGGRGDYIGSGFGKAELRERGRSRGASGNYGNFAFKTERLISHLTSPLIGSFKSWIHSAAEKDRGDMAVVEVLGDVLCDDGFVGFEEIEVA